MSYLVSWFVLPKQKWDLALSVSSIYEDIAASLYEYIMGEAAWSYGTALIKPRCRKVLLDAE